MRTFVFIMCVLVASGLFLNGIATHSENIMQQIYSELQWIGGLVMFGIAGLVASFGSYDQFERKAASLEKLTHANNVQLVLLNGHLEQLIKLTEKSREQNNQWNARADELLQVLEKNTRSEHEPSAQFGGRV